MSLNVSIPNELRNKIREDVESGFYQSASEVVREALRAHYRPPTEGEVLTYSIELRLEEMKRNGSSFIEDPGLERMRSRHAKILART